MGPVLNSAESPVLTTVEGRTSSLRKQVVEALRDEIAGGRMRPGERLIERELSERLGVSRTTIREALRELSAEGLVETIPQKGAIVAVLSASVAAEVYELRAPLEAIVARRCAERASERQLLELRERFAAMEACFRRGGGADQLLAATADLQRILFEGAGNATARSILERFRARIAVIRIASLSVEGRPAESLEEMGGIVEAIERRDGVEAARLSIEHVEREARKQFRSGELAAAWETRATET